MCDQSKKAFLKFWNITDECIITLTTALVHNMKRTGCVLVLSVISGDDLEEWEDSEGKIFWVKE